MSARQPVSVALWDEMRASPRMVAGSVSEGGADPARTELRCLHGAEDRRTGGASSHNSPAGSEVLRNATAAGGDFRVVAIPAQRCIACGNTSVMFSDCPQCAAYAKRGLRVRKCLGCMRATPLPAHRYRCDDCGGREVA